VAKVLWRTAPAQSRDSRLDTQSMSEGEIEMPGFEFEALEIALESGVGLLPESARSFQEWRVAVLERFGVEDGMRCS
jgi:hypothetical protein